MSLLLNQKKPPHTGLPTSEKKPKQNNKACKKNQKNKNKKTPSSFEIGKGS